MGGRKMSKGWLKRLAIAYNANSEIKSKIDYLNHYGHFAFGGKKYFHTIGGKNIPMIKALAECYNPSKRDCVWEDITPVLNLQSLAKESGSEDWNALANEVTEERINNLVETELRGHEYAARLEEGRGRIQEGIRLLETILQKTLIANPNDQRMFPTTSRTKDGNYVPIGNGYTKEDLVWNRYHELFDFAVKHGVQDKAKPIFRIFLEKFRGELEKVGYCMKHQDFRAGKEHLECMARKAGCELREVADLYSKVTISNQEEIDKENKIQKLREQYFGALYAASLFGCRTKERTRIDGDLDEIVDELRKLGVNIMKI